MHKSLFKAESNLLNYILDNTQSKEDRLNDLLAQYKKAILSTHKAARSKKEGRLTNCKFAEGEQKSAIINFFNKPSI